MALSPEEQQVRAREAQKRYRETDKGRKQKREAAARYRARHKELRNAVTRKENRERKGCKNATDEKKTGPCEICGEHRDCLDWDHNHETGFFRGWLCRQCNTGLGSFKDSPDLLLKAAYYLKR